ncbi:MAG TPA: PKD domain-containing protein [Streptosporangiaceae bacterium]
MVLTGTVLASASASAATTYIVDNTNASCSDTGLGTSTQPFCTIAAAAKKALSGDTVQVSAGTYPGTSVNPTNSGVTFTANPGVLISGGSRGFSISSKSNITISGFSITGTSSYGIYVNGSSNVTLAGNTVSGAGQPVSGQSASGIYLSSLNGGLIKGNITHDNAAHGILLTGSTTGVTVQGNTSYHNAYQYQRNANGIDDVAPGNSIIGNVTYANEDTGINIYTGGDNALVAGNVSYGNGDHGIDDFDVTGGRIIGNTIYFNCTDGINVEGTSGNYDIENNVSMNNATGAIINPTPIGINPATGQPYYTNNCNRRIGNIGVYDSAPASTTADYNLVWQSGAGTEYTWAGTSYNSLSALRTATGQESSGIFANPKFTNAAAGNFQLTAGSPAIDSANAAASGEQTTDILGNPRVDDPATPNSGNPSGSYYDRGAYEYQGGGGTPSGPTAALTASPGSGTAPLSVTADASGSTAGSAPISSYSFNFGDGSTAGPQSSPTATHTYQSAGSYTVTVTVTDNNGLTATATKNVTVNAQQQNGPSAALSVSPASGTAPLQVTADASGSTAGSAPISSYSFNFGDGSTAGPQSGPTATHTYQSAGSYTVTVTVTDNNGLTATATKNVTVNAQSASPAKFVNQIATNYSTNSHTSGSVTVWRTGGVAAGDLMVVTVQLTDTSATGAVSGTDSQGDTLTVASDISDGNGDRLVVLSGVAQHGLAVNNVISVTFPTASTYRITADEVSGVAAADQRSAASGTGSTFSSGSTGTISRSGEFVFAAVGTFGGTTLTWNPGWTSEQTYTVGANALGRAYQIPSTTGAFTGSGTGSGSWLAEIVTFT